MADQDCTFTAYGSALLNQAAGMPDVLWPMRALSIRQPYAELILRGIKKVEYRSRPTKIIGERFFIYAAKKWAGVNGHAPHAPQCAGIKEGTAPPLPPLPPLPTGVIVGTAIIANCVRDNDPRGAGYEWHLADVKRIDRPRRPKRQPQPVWFRPF